MSAPESAAAAAPASPSAAAAPVASPAPAAAAGAGAGSEKKGSVTVEDAAPSPEPEKEQKNGAKKGKGDGKTSKFAAEKSRLQRALNANAVGRDLSNRPAAAELAGSGILEQAHVAPSLAQKAKALNKQIVANTLNQKLYAREAAGGVDEHSHLFKAEEVAPRLRPAKVALEHAIRRDRVGQRLEVRPDAAVLLQQGILSSPVSARLQGVQKQLQKHFTADLVAHLLEQRSGIDELAKEGVLRDVRVAPALQGVQRRLEHNLAKSNLFHAMQARPSIEELAQRGIWQPSDEQRYDDEEYESDYDDELEQFEAQQQQLQQQQEAYHQQLALQQQYAAAQQAPMSPSSAANRAANESYLHNPAQSPNTTARYAGMAAAEAAYRIYQHEQALLEQEQLQQQQQQQGGYGREEPSDYAEALNYQRQQHQQHQQQEYAAAAAAASSSQRRSKNFHLTRLLLKACVSLSESGAISGAEKSFLKELIVDQVPEVYAAAEAFDRDNNLAQFRHTLVAYAQRR